MQLTTTHPAHSTYNPEDGRGSRKPASQEQAMSELVEVVKKIKPDGFEPTIISQTGDFLYVEYQSPLLGFIDDVEFWFKPGQGSRVEYRWVVGLEEWMCVECGGAALCALVAWLWMCAHGSGRSRAAGWSTGGWGERDECAVGAAVRVQWCVVSWFVRDGAAGWSTGGALIGLLGMQGVQVH